MSKAVKTRAQFAAEINAAFQKGVDAFFKTGQLLIAARKALPRGTYLQMIETDLRCTARWAQMLVAVAGDERFKRIPKAKRASLLPAALTTRYALTRLTDAEWEQALRSGTINPQMTRAQAQTVRVQISEPRPAYKLPAHFPVTYEPRRVVVPNYLISDEPEEAAPPLRDVASATPPADAPAVALPRAERALIELEESIKRGEVRDAGRVRLFVERAGRLPDLIEAAKTAIN